LPVDGGRRAIYRLADLLADDFFGAVRDCVAPDFRFGDGAGSGEDVSASEAFNAVASAASPLMRSVQASS